MAPMSLMSSPSAYHASSFNRRALPSFCILIVLEVADRTARALDVPMESHLCGELRCIAVVGEKMIDPIQQSWNDP